MNPDSLPRKRGRPLGSKDGRRKEGARPRGRPKKTIPDAADDADNEETDTETANAAGLSSTIHEPDFDASFDAFDAYDTFNEQDWLDIGLGDTSSSSAKKPTSPSLEQLREAKKRSQMFERVGAAKRYVPEIATF
ncbi:hypothetical protein C8R47DRAFT_1219569 [Mycena vitilis]|nr:hypothetical protein C8R47DRAFT_1075010 [Mycena vitilis]KAJ6478633.1 hypothetical protein C8R47DRAFT_1075011 [Mycena vitilis]KAJ6478634.1 hypothetical protein C8R47DRAFT_1219567 [Mycena vitilis]KAJ6478635.1 hypothetical protein C8R47DRAFT_1219568 [Mycena vitilis]KAJ6478636.1 hypothetical protein C8R47DRAFT_1219569 [Mycena vitilis]